MSARQKESDAELIARVLADADAIRKTFRIHPNQLRAVRDMREVCARLASAAKGETAVDHADDDWATKLALEFFPNEPRKFNADAADLALALRAERERTTEYVRGFAWVIERGTSPSYAPHYYLGDNTGGAPVWGPNNALAIRFARKIDAERCLGENLDPNGKTLHRICEHGWHASASADTKDGTGGLPDASLASERIGSGDAPMPPGPVDGEERPNLISVAEWARNSASALVALGVVFTDASSERATCVRGVEVIRYLLHRDEHLERKPPASPITKA